MTGLVENFDEDVIQRHKKESEDAYKILTNIVQNCPEPVKLLRLGRFNTGKTRPLKIIFESSDTPKLILKNRSKLNDNNIKIYSDQTESQRKYMQNLRSEIIEREKKGERNLLIKYIKGVPVVTKASSYPKN